MQAYWHQQERAGPPPLAASFPVIVLPGMSHGQWATFNGTVPHEVGRHWSGGGEEHGQCGSPAVAWYA